MRFDVLACELQPVWAFAESYFHRFRFCVFDLPTIAQNTSDHPEGADANGSSAVNEGGTIFRVVRDLQKLRDLFFVWIAVSDGDVEITQAEFFCFCFFFRRAMFARLSQIDDWFHAVSFQFFEMFEFWLAAGAEVFVDAQEVSDLAGVLGHGEQ